MTPSYALSCLLLSVIAAVFPVRSEGLDDAQDLFASYGNGLVQARVVERETGSKATIGSGFFVSPQGLVVTNFHVISELLYHPQRYLAQFSFGNEHQGELTVLAVDVIHDLALLKADTPANVHFDLARTDPRQGDGYIPWATRTISVSLSLKGPTTGMSTTRYTRRYISPAL